MPLPTKPTLTAAPAAPVRGEAPETFATKGNAFVVWQASQLRPEVQAALDWTDNAFIETEAVFTATEAQRVLAQTARTGAETAQGLSEGARNTALTHRDAAEGFKDSAETAAAAAGAAAGLPSLAGNAGKVLAVNSGASGVEWGVGVASGQQLFTGAGATTFNKPAEATWIYYEAIGGGGGAGNLVSTGTRGGGAGGEFISRLMRAEDVPASLTVTVGAGGTGGNTGSDTAGGIGGNSSFGALGTAYGGRVGPTTTLTWVGINRGGALTVAANPAEQAHFGFGTSAGVSAADRSRNTIYGGAGGGFAHASLGAGGISEFGGNGGAGNATADLKAEDGVAPGGGGGGSMNDGGGGAGAAGIVRVWWW